MITEDYVSFEVAKLLKEKGFDTPCIGRYSVRSREFHLDCTKMCNNGGLFECAAPTHQMAMKWLREEKKIGIEVNIIFDCADDKWYYEYGFCIFQLSSDFKKLAECDYYGYKTYEEAVEAALKYCLENLI